MGKFRSFAFSKAICSVNNFLEKLLFIKTVQIAKHRRVIGMAFIMEVMYNLLKNQVFLATLFSWLIAQMLKSIINLVKERPHSAKEIILRFLWSTGGMPSSHSSVVTALATASGFKYGVDSPVFIVALFYGFLIIRDALGVRRAAGLQAIAINQLIAKLTKKEKVKVKMVKEIHGHRFSEVAVGILLGFFIAVAFTNL